MSRILTRRRVLAGMTAGAAGLVSGCDQLGESPAVRGLLFKGEDAQRWLQRGLTARNALAPEYRPDQGSPIFRSNGTARPDTPAYAAHAASNFADWRLAVDGLVARPLSLSMAQIRSMPARAQITRHDCVEGWSAIGQWSGVPLAHILHLAGLKPEARYIVFRCADTMGDAPYYESIDLIDAFHPQTLVAHSLNGAPLPVENGAPLRMRIERQLGYKHAKYVHTVEAVASLAGIGRGKGGYWEDRAGYQWYAGI